MKAISPLVLVAEGMDRGLVVAVGDQGLVVQEGLGNSRLTGMNNLYYSLLQIYVSTDWNGTLIYIRVAHTRSSRCWKAYGVYEVKNSKAVLFVSCKDLSRRIV